MKSKVIALIALLAIFPIAKAQTLQSIFEKYAEDERFEYVSVGKGMMNMLNLTGAFGSQKDNNNPMQNLANGSTKILTLKAGSDTSIAKTLDSELAKAISNGNYETVVETRDKGQQVHIYSRSTGKDQTEMVIISREKREYSIVWISGKKTKQKHDEPVSQIRDSLQTNG